MLGGMWKEVKFAGEAPCARSQHATCLSEDKKSIYVFGGQAHSKAYNDLWRFDVASSSWEKLEGNGAPESRWGGSLTEHKGVLYLFGGEQVSSADYEHLLGYNLGELRKICFCVHKRLIILPSGEKMVHAIPNGNGSLSSFQPFSDCRSFDWWRQWHLCVCWKVQFFLERIG